MKTAKNKKSILILIIILGLAVYANSINGKFIWDDEVLIRENEYIKDWSYLKKILTCDIAAGAGIDFTSYRPLQMVTYLINYSLGKFDVRIYHLTNIFLHIIAALCIFWLVNILFNDRLISLFTSILFVVHPIHTAAVTYISGRADPLAAIFILLALIFYIKNRFILMLLSFVFALLSRENSLIFPLLILVYHYSFKEKLRYKEFLSISVIALIYILLRLTALQSPLPHLYSSTTISQRMPGFFVAITNYIKMLFLPLNLYMEYGDRLFKFASPRALLGIIIVAGLLIYAFSAKGGSAFGGRRKEKGLIFFSILWFFVTLLPQSNLYPINAYMAEHWLYLPSIGFFLILANGFKAIQKSRAGLNLPYFCVIILLVFYSALTIRHNNYWREPVVFYERALKFVPDSWRMHNNLGNAYSDRGDYKAAISSYKRVIELRPGYAAAYFNLGNVYKDIGNYEAAIALYEEAIEINPRSSKMYNNLGVMYEQVGKYDEAIASYKKALKINPDDIYARNNLGKVLRRK